MITRPGSRDSELMTAGKTGFTRPIAITLLGLMTACSQASDSTTRAGVGRFALDAESLQQWKLPKRLNEISGLALTPDDRLFAIGDEEAIIYELDHQQARIVKAFALGDPTIRGDFEGIAYLNDAFYLVTSNGRLYATAEGNDGDRMQYKTYKTGLGKRCEIEGLAQDVKTNVLMLACKESKLKGEDPTLSVFVWSPSMRKFLDEREIAIPVGDIAEKLDKKRISLSGIAVDPVTASLYAVAARQRAIIEMKPNGELIDAIILPLADRHRQAEGIEITRGGELLIADEGGNKKARLSVYASGHEKTTDRQE